MKEEELIWQGLAQPFDETQIKQRPGRVGLMFDYVDARDVMNRLDLVVGPERWSFEVEVCPDGVAKGRLGIQLESGSWVYREDVGYPNGADDEEPYKSSTSDALKRCAVHFGVGRHLYANTPQRAPAAPVARPAPRREPSRVDTDGYPTDICPVHRVSWTHKVGTARATGKAYDFWACSEKSANGDFCRERPAEGWKPVDESAEDLADIPF